MSDVTIGGVTYPSSEHAYQALKTSDAEAREDIRNAKTPGDAKRLGKQVPKLEWWNEIKVAVMTRVVLAKFTQNPMLKEALMNTGTAWLEEGNHWGDEFWGKDILTKSGDNWLGRILMIVRSELFLQEVNG